jgi:hypothetical protein
MFSDYLTSEDAATKELDSDAVTTVLLQLHAQNLSAGGETKSGSVSTLGRGQTHGKKHSVFFSHHPFEVQVQAAGAQVLEHGLFLEGLIVDVYTPQRRGVSHINSGTRPSFLQHV